MDQSGVFGDFREGTVPDPADEFSLYTSHELVRGVVTSEGSTTSHGCHTECGYKRTSGEEHSSLSIGQL